MTLAERIAKLKELEEEAQGRTKRYGRIHPAVTGYDIYLRNNALPIIEELQRLVGTLNKHHGVLAEENIVLHQEYDLQAARIKELEAQILRMMGVTEADLKNAEREIFDDAGNPK